MDALICLREVIYTCECLPESSIGMQSAISCDAFPLRHAVRRVYDVIGRCIETRQWSIGFELQEHEMRKLISPMMSGFP
jgi:hypothetical protein